MTTEGPSDHNEVLEHHWPLRVTLRKSVMVANMHTPPTPAPVSFAPACPGAAVPAPLPALGTAPWCSRPERDSALSRLPPVTSPQRAGRCAQTFHLPRCPCPARGTQAPRGGRSWGAGAALAGAPPLTALTASPPSHARQWQHRRATFGHNHGPSERVGAHCKLS